MVRIVEHYAEKTLLALADHGDIGAMLPHDGTERRGGARRHRGEERDAQEGGL